MADYSKYPIDFQHRASASYTESFSSQVCGVLLVMHMCTIWSEHLQKNEVAESARSLTIQISAAFWDLYLNLVFLLRGIQNHSIPDFNIHLCLKLEPILEPPF